MSTTVPFGKYKGRPVEDMLADAEYMAWLEAQPWFRERYNGLLAGRDTEAASRTPVHNRLQTLFLDPHYRRAFVMCAAGDQVVDVARVVRHVRDINVGKLRGMLEQQRNKVAGYMRSAADFDAQHAAGEVPRWSAENYAQSAFRQREEAEKAAEIADLIAAEIEALACSGSTVETGALFEHEGADVRVTILVTGQDVVDRVSGFVLERNPNERETWLNVEIKPTVSDEYPAVLRQMKRNGSSYLFVDRYQGEGATEAQFAAIFAASGIKVVFKRDVDALVTQGPA